MWISKENRNRPTFDEDNGIIITSNLSGILEPKGEVIEGWQRIEKTFTASNNNNDSTFLISEPHYIDDIRIFPADGNMQTYVYDPHNYRLKAILDNNNHATFYNYDAEGNVKSVKKETERGIVTIQENVSYTKGNMP